MPVFVYVFRHRAKFPTPKGGFQVKQNKLLWCVNSWLTGSSPFDALRCYLRWQLWSHCVSSSPLIAQKNVPLSNFSISWNRVLAEQTPKQPRTALPFHGDGSSESPHHYSAVYIAPVQFPTFPQGRLILASLALRLSVGTQTQLLPCAFCAASSRPCLLPCYADALLAEGSFFICQKIRNWFHVEHGPWSGWGQERLKTFFCGME